MFLVGNILTGIAKQFQGMVREGKIQRKNYRKQSCSRRKGPVGKDAKCEVNFSQSLG